MLQAAAWDQQQKIHDESSELSRAYGDLSQHPWMWAT